MRFNFVLFLAIAAFWGPRPAQGQTPAQAVRAQQLLQQGRWVPRWLPDTRVVDPANGTRWLQAPAFEGALYDAALPNLPVHDLLVPVAPNQEWTIQPQSSPSEEKLSPHFAGNGAGVAANLFAQSEWYPAQPVVVGPKVCIRKQWYQHVRLYPLQVHQSLRRVRQHSELRFSASPRSVAAPARRSTQSFASASVLATGTWYKLATTKSGIVKIDRALLQNLGLDPAGIDPRQLRVFGTGGARLPQANSTPRADDLVENPIKVVGEQDGRWDDGDYALLYAQGAHPWVWDSLSKRWFPDRNFYTDSTYFFLTLGPGNGLRMANGPASPMGTLEVRTTPGLVVLEEDKHNLRGMGRQWFGDEFDLTTTRSYSLNLPGLKAGTTCSLRVRVAARHSSSTTWDVTANGQLLTSSTKIACGGVPIGLSYGTYAGQAEALYQLPASSFPGNQLNLKLQYNQVSGSQGWLDKVEVHYVQDLQTTSNEVILRLLPAVGHTHQRVILPQGTDFELWDVTTPWAPVRVPTAVVGTDLVADVAVPAYRILVAFRGSSFPTLVARGSVPNQNLHALPQAQYVLVAPGNLMAQANQLANMHRTHYGRSVLVVDLQQLYNEFGGGRPDLTAIRDFMRMLYVRAQTPEEAPQYLCLFGDASFDYKGIEQPRPVVPNYQACESMDSPVAYGTDDYFGFLDDNEGRWNEDCSWYILDRNTDSHGMDLAVGRLPVNTPDEAQVVVNKLVRYATDPGFSGDWRQRLLFFADYDPTEIFGKQSEGIGGQVEAQLPCYQQRKLYLDSWDATNQAEGLRYPEAQQELIRQLDQGSLFVNYMGHGGETGLSNARILEINDISNLRNDNRNAFWVTATCDFGRLDEPALRCGAEQLLLNTTTGSIGALTAVRPVYVSGNEAMNRNYLTHQTRYDTTLGRFPTLGESTAWAKNQLFGTSVEINTRNFVLIGDPGLVPAFPQQQLVITALNEQAIDPLSPDTLKALSKVKVEGEVRRADGSFNNGFTGELTVNVFDKKRTSTSVDGTFSFKQFDTKLFGGLVSVSQGRFRFEFYVPLDINYQPGKGNLMLYAQAGGQDAIGCTQDFIICCTDPNATANAVPPTVEVFMNDENWIAGGIVNQSPSLLALCQDDMGINTTGLGVGRELTLVLNQNESNPQVLNDYYQATKDKFNEGRIEFPLRDLAAGEYTARVKVWDVTNNSAVAETRFVVAEDAKLALEHVLNYPNPFTTSTEFYFNHNRPGQELDAQVRIFTVSGKLVKFLRSTFVATGTTSNPLQWDGLDEYGDRIGRGVYVYELTLKVPSSGEVVRKMEKLVLLR